MNEIDPEDLHMISLQKESEKCGCCSWKRFFEGLSMQDSNVMAESGLDAREAI